MSDVMITVDGVEMPTPSSFTWELYDISARDIKDFTSIQP